MPLKLKLTQRGLLLVAVPLFIEFVLVATLGFLLTEVDRQAARQSEHKVRIAEAESAMKCFYDAVNALSLYALTKDTMAERRYADAAVEVSETLRVLMDSVQNNEKQRLSLARLVILSNEGLKILDGFKKDVTVGDLSLVSTSSTRKKVTSIADKLVANLHDFVDTVKEEERIDPADTERLRTLVQACLVAAGATSLLFILASIVFYRDMTSRLTCLMDNTTRVAEGRPLNQRITGSDEITHLDAVFHDMANALKEAARVKQEFVEMISHDLRTPLTSILAFTSSLVDGVYGELSPSALDSAQSTEVSASRLIRMVNDLLDFEKLEAGQLQLMSQTIDTARLIQQAFNEVKGFSDQQGIELSFTPLQSHTIIGDEGRLLQVLVNLLGNAIKFSSEQSTITVSTSPFGRFIQFRVIDRGRGIPANMLESIFDRFSQVDVSDGSRERGGTGLGLAICKAIVELHGGIIGVQSVVGTGTTFWFTIPAADESVGSAAIALTDKCSVPDELPTVK